MLLLPKLQALLYLLTLISNGTALIRFFLHRHIYYLFTFVKWVVISAPQSNKSSSALFPPVWPLCCPQIRTHNTLLSICTWKMSLPARLLHCNHCGFCVAPSSPVLTRKTPQSNSGWDKNRKLYLREDLLPSTNYPLKYVGWCEKKKGGNKAVMMAFRTHWNW